jgi:type III secretion protein C
MNRTRSLLLFIFCTFFPLLAYADTGSGFLAQNEPESAKGKGKEKTLEEGYLINFNNLDIIEVIRFISKISGKNFIFDEALLNFRVTIVSEEPTTIENIMTALLQVLRINNLTMLEQGNNILIHSNAKVKGPSRLEGAGIEDPNDPNSEIITQVFKVNNIDAQQAADLIKDMLSERAQVQVLLKTQHVIVTDFTKNIERISLLIKGLDAPMPQTEIGQYVIRNVPLLSLVALTRKLLAPIANGTIFDLIPEPISNTIFIVSSPYVVERAISIMQTLDTTRKQTRILTMENLKYMPEDGQNFLPENQGGGAVPGFSGQLGPDGLPIVGGQPGFGVEIPGGTVGQGQTGAPGTQGTPGQAPRDLRAETRVSGQPVLLTESDNKIMEKIRATGFRIYKLQNRKSNNVQQALQDIGTSLRATVDPSDVARKDLLEAIRSIEEIEDSNSLVFSGSEETLIKVEQLIRELDVPLRQVFIEMLVLETTVSNSLSFGVDWGVRFNDSPNWGGTSGLYGSGSKLPNALLANSANTIGNNEGFNLGVIGSVLKQNGTPYATLGALVTALQTDTDTKIVMNPKIITEDTQPAELFVGINTRFQTSSISNDTGTIVTSNFEFRDVGTLLKVTPYLGDGDIITLQIDQEISSSVESDTALGQVQDSTIGPTTRTARTTTRVHVPDKHFLILSGMIQDTKTKTKSGLPCLGGLPGVGAAFSQNRTQIDKSNIMLFVRPIIIDTPEEMRHLTRDQNKLMEERCEISERFQWELESGLDFLNCDDLDSCGEPIEKVRKKRHVSTCEDDIFSF